MKKTYKVILQLKCVLETKNRKIIESETALKKFYFSFLGLQMTDVELDERITALEENGGNGNGKTIDLFNMMQGPCLLSYERTERQHQRQR